MEHSLLSPSLSQSHRMMLSFAMQQSLHVLQLPILELAEWVNNEITKNPLIAYSEPQEFCAPSQNECTSKPSLFEHLMAQAKEVFSSSEEMELAELIIGNLDEKGFLALPIHELPYDRPLFQTTLATIQQFDPHGIAAYNLQHSFLLQLELQGKKHSLAYQIIENHYECLLHNQLQTLSNKMECSLHTIKRTIQNDIKSLSINPGYSFNGERAIPIYPDILICEDEDQYVQINESLIPKFQILTCELPELKTYVRAAQDLIKALDQRKKTLQKIGTFVSEKQKKFLSCESNHLEPISLKELASALELHEATISRAVKDKYISCPRGLLPLYTLFARGSIRQNEGTSSDVLKQKIEELIKREDKRNPISDEILCLKLKQLGYQCTRRTITKYRNSLNLPHASQRRQW